MRRTALTLVENFAKTQISKISESTLKKCPNANFSITPTTSLLLNKISLNSDYTYLKNIDNIYIPLKFFTQKDYKKILETISKKFNLYIYLPTIIRSNYMNLLKIYINETLQNYNIKGFILSNISNFKLLENINNNNFEFIANYTLNIFNKYTINELSNLGINKFTISPELDKKTIQTLIENSNQELIIYGRTPLMNMNYCPLGKSNHCYPNCEMKCNTENTYYLEDRMNLKFPILPDNIQTVSTLFNSKITSISKEDFPNCSVRIDILDEPIDKIQNIIDTVNSGKKFEGPEFTNGNINKIV